MKEFVISEVKSETSVVQYLIDDWTLAAQLLKNFLACYVLARLRLLRYGL